MDNVTAAKYLIGLLDLTSLDEHDTFETTENLCQRAFTPHGNVAAVCVYSRFVSHAKTLLQNSNIKVATVVNFPSGGSNFIELSREINQAIDNGADEIDAVLPYKNLISHDQATCQHFFHILKTEAINQKIPVKVIIESGELKTPSLITEASRLCLDNDVSFIKTSTGKTPISATPEAANLILETISSGRRNIGFKASGGIKKLEDAKKYLILASAIMGYKWITPKNFRLGASSLLDDLLQTIERGY